MFGISQNHVNIDLRDEKQERVSQQCLEMLTVKFNRMIQGALQILTCRNRLLILLFQRNELQEVQKSSNRPPLLHDRLECMPFSSQLQTVAKVLSHRLPIFLGI